MLASIALNGSLGFAIVVATLFCLGNEQEALNSPTGFPFIEVFANATGSNAGANAMASSSKTYQRIPGLRMSARHQSSSRLWFLQQLASLQPLHGWLGPLLANVVSQVHRFSPRLVAPKATTLKPTNFFWGKGGASHISSTVLHRTLYYHKLATRSYQHRVLYRVQRLDFTGRRILLLIFCPVSDYVPAQKAHYPGRRTDIRSFPAWSRKRPNHLVVLGL